MKKYLSKKLTGRLCTALVCGLLFTAGGQWEKAEAADKEDLYGAENGVSVIEVPDRVSGIKKLVVIAENGTVGHGDVTHSSYTNLKSGAAFSVYGGEWNDVYGGLNKIHLDKINVQNNRVNISGGTVTGDIYGGCTYNGSANGNRIVISGKTSIAGDGKNIYGGYSDFSGFNVDDNSVIITGGTFSGKRTIYGSYADKSSGAAAQNNTVAISGGTFEGEVNIYGGSAGGGIAQNNTVIISGGTFEGKVNIDGGYASGGIAINNTVTISGGNFKDDGVIIDGGRAPNIVQNNTVNLIGIGGMLNGISHNGEVLKLGIIGSGHTLNITGTGTVVTNVRDFANVNFIINSGMKNNDTMLKVNFGLPTTTFLGKKAVNVKAEAGANLQAGTVINLVHKVDAEELKLPNPTAENKGVNIYKSGVSANFATVDLLALDDDGDGIANDLVLTVKENVSIADNAELGTNAKNMVETRAAGLAVVNEGVDFMTGQGLSQAKLAAKTATAEGSKGFAPFAAMGGGNMRYNSGSHVDSKSWHGAVGVAKEIGDLTLGFAVGYGRSSFDSYNAGGIHGSGDSKGTGFTVLSQWQKDKGVHYEAALQAGRVKNDYSANLSGFDTHYDESSNYYGLTLGGGKEFVLSDKNSVDVYGLYFWSHTNGSDTVTNHGDRMSFDAINSHRLRLGSRFTREVNKVSSLYAGLAWQYEFKGDARATINGQGAPSPSLKGHSGLLEIGWKANAGKNFTVDLGLNGWAGKQQGISGNVGFEWKF